MTANIDGVSVPATDSNINATTDLAKVQKYYKLNSISWLEATKDEKTKRSELDTLVISSIALRGL